MGAIGLNRRLYTIYRRSVTNIRALKHRGAICLNWIYMAWSAASAIWLGQYYFVEVLDVHSLIVISALFTLSETSSYQWFRLVDRHRRWRLVKLITFVSVWVGNGVGLHVDIRQDGGCAYPFFDGDFSRFPHKLADSYHAGNSHAAH